MKRGTDRHPNRPTDQRNQGLSTQPGRTSTRGERPHGPAITTRWFIGLALAMTVATTAFARPAMAAGQKYALLIGVNDYATPLTDLQYCRNDVQALRDILLSIGFPEAHVVCMYDGASNTDFYPTRENILRQLSLRLDVATQEDDVVLVAFSGHGFLEGQMSYLCPCDANAESVDTLMASCISMEQVYERMKVCRAGQKVMMIDACRNMAEFRCVRTKGSEAQLKGFTPASPPKGIRLLSSCEAGQKSVEDTDLKHGVFMHYVAQGLRGYADQECEGNRNGRVSLDELYFYAHQRTKMHVANQFGLLQLPWMKGEVTGLCELGTAPDELPQETQTHMSGGVLASGSGEADPASIPGASPSNVPAAGGMTATGTSEPRLPPSYVALSNQADNYLQASDYSNAVAAYSAIIEDSSFPLELRKDARRRRGAAYLARAKEGDLEKAIIDHQAAGMKGVNVSVQASKADLKRGNQVLGTVQRGQVLEITECKEDWLWVASVNSSESMRGWVHKQALSKEEKPSSTTLASYQPRPSSTTANNNSNTTRYTSYDGTGYPNSGNTRSLNSGYQNQPSMQGADRFTQNYMQRNGRPPSIWETPRWESLREIREKRAMGLLR